MRNMIVRSAVLGLLASGIAAAQVPSAVEPPLLTVTGTAEASAKPDRAILRLGATAQAPQAAEAQAKVSQVVQKTLEALGQVGVAKEDLSTAGLSLTPVYSQPNPRNVNADEPFVPKISGYQASNTVEVRLSDLSKVGPAIDAAVGAGANQVESLTFDLKDDTEVRSRALAEAVARAKSKAEVMAKAADVPLVRLYAIEEQGASSPPIPYRGVAMRAMAAEASTPIEPGQVRVSATVTLRYYITPQK